jgi:hypothetical protein
MSGLLRRIKRSRPADAGEPTREGRAAETEGAATMAETPLASEGSPAETASGSSGSGATSADATPSQIGGPTATASGEDAKPSEPVTSKRARLPPFRRRSRRLAATAQPAAPVLRADPNVPAGIDPADVPMRPPTGRRGRLRRRLRYLRRARELMLRDLGGLLYEVHRTDRGNVEAHASVVGAKVQRIAGLDAEAHALETALAAPRGESVLFEPGVGGTCAACGDLYGSDARFCSNCGTPIGAVIEKKTTEVVNAPARRAFWRRAARPAAPTDDTAVMSATETSTGEAVAPGDAPATEEATTRADAAGTSGDATAPDPARTSGDATAPDLAGTSGEATSTDEATTGADMAGTSGDATANDEATTGADAAGTKPRDEAETEGSSESAAGRPASGGDEPRSDAADESGNPFPGLRNGRPDEQRKHPGPASVDPFVSRERS